ncbi:MAG TPA: AAA family ATPase [Jiangellales bacterium]|nr:AAA family ATPase [Jiangellales bacterium]
MQGLLARTLVGRDEQRRALDEIVDAASRGQGRAVALVAEAGLGKSRLRAQAERVAADAGLVLLSGRAVEGPGARPLRAVAEAVAGALRDPGIRAAGTPGLLGPTLARLDEVAARPLDAAVPVGVVGLAEAVLNLLVVTCRGRGALLSIDDLHWSDPDELAVVEYLVDAVDAHGASILLTARPIAGNAATALLDRLSRRRALRLLDVGPLHPSDVDRLVLSCLDQDACPAELTDFVHERADGNPFHVEELLAGLQRSGALLRGPDGWTVVGRRLRTTAPTTLALSLRTRLNEVSPATRRTLGALAVLGHQADWSLLQRVLDAGSEQVLAAVREAESAQLVVPDGSAVRFRHALVRDEVVAGLLRPERVELARRALAAVREEQPGLPGTWSDIAAELAELADDPAQAATFLLGAAEDASRRGALGSAAALLERAEELDPGTAGRVAAGLARVHALAGEVDRALAAGRRALGALRVAPSQTDATVTEEAYLELVLARALTVGGRSTAARERTAAARALADRVHDEELTAWVEVTAAAALLAAGDAPRAEELASTVAARAGAPPDARCEALEVVGRCARLRDVAAAEASFAAALDLATRYDLPGWRARALHELGTVDLLDTMRLDRLRDARRAAVAAGSPATVAAVDFHLAEALVARGQVAEGREVALRAVGLARRLGSGILPYALVTAARSYGHERRRADMEELLDQAFAVAPGDVEVEASAWERARAMLALHEADPEGLLGALDRAAALLVDRPAHHAPHRGLWALASTLHSPDGGATAREVTRHAAGAGTRFNRALLTAADAVTTGRAGDLPGAETLLDRALADLAGYEGARWMHHTVHWLVAGAAHRDGWGDPVGWLRAAVRWFADHDQPALATSSRVALRDMGAPVPRQGRGASPVPPSLRALGVTSREVDVLALLPERLTNRQVADRLVVSPRTVEKHVAALLAKTGRPDRQGLATLARELGLSG